jgi:hypothetical protein
VSESTMLDHREAVPPEAAGGSARASRWPVVIFATRRLRQEWPVDPVQPLTRLARLFLVAEIVRIYLPTRARIVCNRLRLLEQVEGSPVVRARSRSGEFSREREATEAARAGGAVRRTLELLPTDSSCLTRSLVLMRLLSRRGIESSLVIAVASGGDSFVAHAWVEHRGTPLLDPGSDDLTRLVQLDVPKDHEHDGESNQ